MEAPWKMPTKFQCEELINKTTNTWTAMNGVNGMKFTNKSDSSKYIFTSATGYWSLTSLGYGARSATIGLPVGTHRHPVLGTCTSILILSV